MDLVRPELAVGLPLQSARKKLNDWVHQGTIYGGVWSMISFGHGP